MTRRLPIPLALGALTLGLLPGCAGSIDFNSPSPLGHGVRGKYWRAPAFVDSALYSAAAQSPTHLLHAFDAAVSGSTVQVVGTWHAQNQTVYRGYARQYSDSAGWSSPGPLFGQIASNGATDLGFASVMAGPNNLFASVFFQASGAGGSAVSAQFAGNSWLSYPAASALGAHPGFDHATQDFIGGPRAVSAMDGLGRGFVFYSDASLTPRLWFTDWAGANTNGIGAAVQDVTGADLRAPSGISARFDGVKQACVSYELSSGPSLRIKCLDVTLGGAFDFSSASATATTDTLSTAAMAGHETATDGAGKVMAVFYQETGGGEYHVYASLGADGAFPAAPTRIDAAMASGYHAPSPAGGTAQVDGARPGVAYAGSGRFIAVWPGIHPADKKTSLFYSLYEGGAWSDAASIPGTEDEYLVTPHPQGLHVFANGDGNAAFALNKIHASEAIGSLAAAVPDVYPESAGARRVQVARWQEDDGWLPVSTVGNSCFTGGSGAGGDLPAVSTDGRCTHRPTGVMLPSGNALVFFMDRDNHGDSASVGNHRLSVTEFR